MPTRIDGCGTGYYGKSNLTSRQGVCESCHRSAVLSSYDTNLYFSLLFIPIVPLGKKRVLDYCSRCTKHRAMPLETWNRARDGAGAAAVARLRAHGTDPAATAEALRTLAGFDQIELFRGVYPDVLRAMEEHADVLQLAGLVAEKFAMESEAERAYRASLKALDEEPTRELLAACLIRQGRPDEAETLLQHLTRMGNADRTGLLFLLVEGYQAAGRHDRALQWLDRIVSIAPQVAKQKAVRKARRISEQNRTKGTRIVSPRRATAGAPVGSSGGELGGRIARLIGPALLLIGAGAYVYAAWHIGRNRTVWLVDGLATPYTVLIDGSEHAIEPGRPVTAKVREGALRIEVASGGPALDTQLARVETPFWSRPFRDRTIVINPDRAALIHWTKASYSPRDSQSEPPPDQVVQHGGELVHQFTGIHYAFEPFPAELKTSNKGSIYKTGLSLVDAGAPFSVLSSLNAMMMSGDEANALTIVQRHATLEPEQFVYVRLLSSLMDTEEFLAFVRPGLDARPLRVEWHRAYQEAVETSGAQTDLAAEYDARLAADPADANLIYLAGRARQDPEEAETYFRRAADATPPSPWALSALNYDLMSEGRFEEALDFGRRAAALDPANLGFQSLLYDALLANGLYPEAIEQARTLRLLMTGRQDRTWVNLELIPQVLSGDEAAVNGLLARTTDWVSSLGGDAADQAHMRRGLEGDVAYIQGRPDEALEKWKDLDDYRFEVAVTSGQFAAALALLQENEENLDSSDHLLAYLLAQRAGDDAAAVRHRERAAESLAQGNADQRRFAAALRDPASADLPALMKVPLKDSDKLLALTALGVASPLARPTLYPLARKLDYRPDFPHLFIRSWLDALPAE